MADYTQPLTNSPPNIFIQTLKDGIPGIQLGQIFNIYKSAVQKDPGYVAKTDPADLADEAVAAAKAAQAAANGPDTTAAAPAAPAVTTTGSAPTSMAPAANLAQVTVTGSRQPPQAARLNTELASPYRGTTQELANPENPTASGQSQFDPAAMQAAQQKYADYVNNSQLARGAGQFFAALGGANSAQAQAPWEAQDKLQEAITIGAQKAMQEQATAGTTNATALQNMAQTAGKYQGTQQEQQQKLDTSMIALKQNQMLNTPGTRQAKVAELMAQKYATQTGNALPKDFVGKYSVADMATLGLLPKDVIANYIDLAKGRTENAGADIAQGVAGAVTTKPQPVALSGAGTERLKYSALPIPGGGALAPVPADIVRSTGSGEAANAAESQARAYNTTMAPAIQRLRESFTKNGSGKGTLMISQWMPGNDTQELANLMQSVNNAYPSILPAAVGMETAKSLASGGFTGAAVAGMTSDQVKRFLDSIEATAGAGKAYQLKKDTAEAGGAAPQSTGVNTPNPSTAPVIKTQRMTKDGKSYDIPLDKVAAAKAKGYQ